MVRVKKRYLTLHFERTTDVSRPTPSSLTDSLPLSDASICSSIRAAVQELHGDFGQAAVSLGMRSAYCNADTRVAVLQVRHGPHRLVASALPFVSKVADQKVIVTLIYTGGTIRHCYKRLELFQRHQLSRSLTQMKASGGATQKKAHQLLEKKIQDTKTTVDVKP